MQLDEKLTALGFNGIEVAAVLGSLIGRMVSHRAANGYPCPDAGRDTMHNHPSGATLPLIVMDAGLTALVVGLNKIGSIKRFEKIL